MNPLHVDTEEDEAFMDDSQFLLTQLTNFLDESGDVEVSQEQILERVNFIHEQLDLQEEGHTPTPRSRRSSNNSNPPTPSKSPRISSPAKRSLRQSARGSPLKSPRPAPYEIWRESHPSVMPKESVKRTEQQWDNTVNRLNESGRMQKMSLLHKQRKQIAQQFSEFSFAPEINDKSREMAKNIDHLPDRLDHIMRLKRDKQYKSLQQRKQDELASVTFKPNTEIPCVCGNAKEGENMNPNKHTEFCVNFMNACSKLKTRISNKKLSKRSVQDLFDFASQKEKRMAMRKKVVEETKQREMTFSPQISRNSTKIYERMIREGRHSGSQALVRSGSNPTLGHEEEVFVPEINERSKFARRSGDVDICQRLYQHGMQHKQKRQSTDTNIHSQYIKKLDLPVPVAEVSPRKFQVATVPVRESQDPMGVTQVVFDANEHSFILARLGVTN